MTSVSILLSHCLVTHLSASDSFSTMALYKFIYLLTYLLTYLCTAPSNDADDD